MPEQPQLLGGRYRLLNVVASGGMGQVWEAADELLARRVAVKEVRFPANLPEEERAVLADRTMREAKLTARLTHRGIITIYDVVCVEDRPYIVMELVRAPSLARRVDEAGPVPPREVADIGVQLLDALAIAHAEGIVHRDVKPSNVLLAPGRAVLTDFGIAMSQSDASLTSTGLLVGSPTYMSPERLRGEPIGPAADIWSVGATLYAALEGQPPFRASTTMATITSVLVDEPERPYVGGPLADAITGMLEKDVGNRLTGDQASELLRTSIRTTVPGRAAAPALQPPAARAQPPVMSPVVTWQRAPSSWPAGDESRPSRARGRGWVAALAAGAVVVAAALLATHLMTASSAATHPDRRPVPAGKHSPGLTGQPRHDNRARHSHPASTPTPATPSTSLPSPIPTTTPTPSATRQSPSPTVSSTAPSTLTGTDIPAGYRLVQDPLGFRLAVPDGWTRRVVGPRRVDYVSPDNSAMYLRIDQVPQAAPSAVQAWRRYEPTLSQQLPGFRLVGIRPVHFRSWKAADLEFTWRSSSGTIHVLDRGIITDPRGFALLMSGPQSTWQSSSLPVFDVAAATFQPT